MKATKMSVDRWMDKENIVYSYNGIWFSCKKEGNPVICDNMDGPGRSASEISQLQRTNTTWFHLYEISKIVKFIEEENGMVAARGQGEKEMGSCSRGIELQL